MSRLGIALSLLVSSSVVWAEEPKAPPEVKKTVDTFVGKWNAELSLTMPGQPPVKFKGVFDCKKIAGGTAVYCQQNTKVPGMGQMEESDLIVYDPETRSIRFMTWSNQGEIHDHKGTWKDDKTIEIKHEATMGGKPLSEVFEFTVTGPNTMAFKFTQKLPEGTSLFEGKATRGK
jgi:hypothetical protein